MFTYYHGDKRNILIVVDHGPVIPIATMISMWNIIVGAGLTVTACISMLMFVVGFPTGCVRCLHAVAMQPLAQLPLLNQLVL